jgi:hypothetical protein
MTWLTIHATLNTHPALLIYEHDHVRGFVHIGLSWRETDAYYISQGAEILSARQYTERFPGLKLPPLDVAA